MAEKNLLFHVRHQLAGLNDEARATVSFAVSLRASTVFRYAECVTTDSHFQSLKRAIQSGGRAVHRQEADGLGGFAILLAALVGKLLFEMRGTFHETLPESYDATDDRFQHGISRQ